MRDPKLKQTLLNRLKSIEGHVRGIQRMVEDEQYCIDILNQTAAIQKALEKVDVLILENHLETCVTTAIQSDDPGERERVIRELLLLFHEKSDIRRQISDLGNQQPPIVSGNSMDPEKMGRDGNRASLDQPAGRSTPGTPGCCAQGRGGD